MDEKKERTLASVDKETLTDLRRLALDTGRKPHEMLDDAIVQFIKRDKKRRIF